MKFLKIFLSTAILVGSVIADDQEVEKTDANISEDCKHLEAAINLLGNDLKETYFSKKLSNCCEYNEIVCSEVDGQNHIVTIKFDNHKSFDKKESEAFDELSNLNYLTTLQMVNFMFSTGLPKSIGKFKKLENLILNHNTFHTDIPEEIGNIKSLVKIDLSFNYLTGNIPPSFATLENLKSLNLGNNRLEGPLPYYFKNLTNLQEMKLNGNIGLRGYVPLIPNISNCDYDLTNLCNLKSSKCSSAFFGCSMEMINQTNSENGNPFPNSDEFVKEVNDKPDKGGSSGLRKYLIIALTLVIAIIIVIYIYVRCYRKRYNA
jgi:hypothetical protein